MLVVHGAGRPSKILQDRYMGYITFKTRFSFKKHKKSGAHLMATEPACVKSGFWGKFMLLLGGNSVGDEDTLPYCNLRFDCC